MTTNDETYNGWTNRETWTFMLYVQNDEGLSESARECVTTAAAGAEWAPYVPDDDEMRAAFARTTAADALKDWAEMHFTRDGYTDDTGGSWPDDLADMAAEIGSLWRINWTECVTALTEDQS